jgi:hypothetical protein
METAMFNVNQKMLREITQIIEENGVEILPFKHYDDNNVTFVIVTQQPATILPFHQETINGIPVFIGIPVPNSGS